jgi:subtilase family protein
MGQRLKLPLLAATCALVASCQTLTLQPRTAPNAMDTTMSSYRASKADRYIIVTMTDEVHEQLVHGERVDREGALPPLYAEFLAQLARTYRLKRVADWPLDSLGIRCFVFEVQDAASRDTTIAALGREPRVESAQRLSTYFVSSSSTASGLPSPEDPYRNLQHARAEMQLDPAQRWASGKGVRVAVVDTGVDTRHPDLQGRVVGVRNFVDRDSRTFNSDVHGTAVAGVIAATANNGIGLAGVAPEADLLAFKACWQSKDTGRAALCSTFTLAKAINFAIGESVDVINLSLGGPPDALLARLVSKAQERNIVVVGATHPDWPAGFPAGAPGVIAVTTRQRSEADAIAVSAPGGQVLSTKPAGEYDFYSGSSFSAAHIAGLTALIRQLEPDLPGDRVRELIVTTAEPASHMANACRALARLIEPKGDCAETARR